MSRLLCGALLSGALSLALLPTNAVGQDADKNKCTISIKGDNQVVKACAAGGLKRAKATMKAMQKAAKEKGLKHECDDCHKDESAGDWTITKDGEEKFKKMLAVLAEEKKPEAKPEAK